MSNVQIPLSQSVNPGTFAPENYTQVGGVYSGNEQPQFLTHFDNVQGIPVEFSEPIPEDQDLRFFRIK